MTDIPVYGSNNAPAASNAPIAIVGSSLAAVDAAVRLICNGHTGPIDFYSRTRTLPSIRPRAGISDGRKIELLRALMAPKHLKLQYLMSILTEFASKAIDFHHQQEKWRHPWNRSIVATLSTEIEFFESGEELVQATLDATSTFISELWQRLPNLDKTLFLQKYNSRWQMIRHSMPITNGKILQQAANDGQLHSYRLRCRPNNRTIIGDNGDYHLFKRTYVHVVDARGHNMQPTRLPELVAKLLDRGLIEPSSHGGIAVDWNTARPTLAGLVTSLPLYFIGGLTRGTYFYTNSIETTITTVDRLVADIIRSRQMQPLQPILFVPTMTVDE